jgi:dolichyl-phosphate beta-glucosyltransferase
MLLCSPSKLRVLTEQRSVIRNALMHSFHLILRLLTPPATSRIRDTQCGFKLFSRASLPHIIPYMHAEGWIFDVEMLMLAESAPTVIRVAEIQIGWQEIGGSKLNVLWDSLGMAWGLALLRASWMLGVYKRR